MQEIHNHTKHKASIINYPQKKTQPLNFTSEQYFKQSQQCQAVRDYLLEAYLSVSVDPSSYLRIGWGKTRRMKENEDSFSVLGAACVSDLMSDVTALSARAVWCVVVLSLYLFLTHFTAPFLPFCLSLWRRACLTTPRGYFGTWPLPPSSSPHAGLTLSAPPAWAAAAGGYYTGVWGVTGDAKVTAHTQASTLAL